MNHDDELFPAPLFCFLLALSAAAFHGVHAQDSCVPEEDFVTMNRRLANTNNRFPTSDAFKFEIHNNHELTVTGFDSTSAIGLGFRCFDRCSLGPGMDNQAKATVSQLVLGGTRRVRVWQFSQPHEIQGGHFRNELFVNGVKYETEAGCFASAYGYSQATDQGEIELMFVDTDESFTMGFSQIKVARVCGYATDNDCSGGELCEGTESDLASGDGVCTIGVKNAMTMQVQNQQWSDRGRGLLQPRERPRL